MTIFARPVGTWSSPTLMDLVLLCPIRNRVRYGFFFFFKKKKTRSRSGSGSGFIKKIQNPTQNQTRIKPSYPEITKIPPIYSYNLTLNPLFLQQQLTPPSVLTLTPTLHQLSPSFQLTQLATHASPPHPYCLAKAHSLTAFTHSQSLPHTYALTHAVMPRLASPPSQPHKSTQPFAAATLFLRTLSFFYN